MSSAKSSERQRPYPLGITLSEAKQLVQQSQVDHLEGHPLWLAIKYKNKDVTKFLLEAGANANMYQGILCDTFLHRAVQSGSVDIVALLLAYRADVDAQNKDGYAPLHLAVKNGDIEIVKLLLENGADLNIMNTEICQYTPLEDAVVYDYAEIAEFLLAEGAKVYDSCVGRTYEEAGYGTTLLHESVNGSFSMLKVVFSYTKDVIDINQKDTNYGLTPLHLAVDSLSPDKVQFLLENGADPNIEDGEECTPLYWVVLEPSNRRDRDGEEQYEKTKLIVKLLLENGANPNLASFHSYESDLQSLALKTKMGKTNIKFKKNIVEIFYNAHYIKKITREYLRISSQQEGLFVPEDLVNIIKKYTYNKNQRTLDLKNLKSVKTILASLAAFFI